MEVWKGENGRMGLKDMWKDLERRKLDRRVERKDNSANFKEEGRKQSGGL